MQFLSQTSSIKPNHTLIATCKLADLVILDRDPLKVDAAAIREIEVLETIKESRTIFPTP